VTWGAACCCCCCGSAASFIISCCVWGVVSPVVGKSCARLSSPRNDCSKSCPSVGRAAKVDLHGGVVTSGSNALVISLKRSTRYLRPASCGAEFAAATMSPSSCAVSAVPAPWLASPSSPCRGVGNVAAGGFVGSASAVVAVATAVIGGGNVLLLPAAAGVSTRRRDEFAVASCVFSPR